MRWNRHAPFVLRCRRGARLSATVRRSEPPGYLDREGFDRGFVDLVAGSFEGGSARAARQSGCKDEICHSGIGCAHRGTGHFLLRALAAVLVPSSSRPVACCSNPGGRGLCSRCNPVRLEAEARGVVAERLDRLRRRWCSGHRCSWFLGRVCWADDLCAERKPRSDAGHFPHRPFGCCGGSRRRWHLLVGARSTGGKEQTGRRLTRGCTRRPHVLKCASGRG